MANYRNDFEFKWRIFSNCQQLIYEHRKSSFEHVEGNHETSSQFFWMADFYSIWFVKNLNESIWQLNRFETHLSSWKLFQEGFGLVGYTKFEVWCNFNLNAREFSGNKRFKCTEIFRIRVQGLKIDKITQINILFHNQRIKLHYFDVVFISYQWMVMIKSDFSPTRLLTPAIF